MRGAGHRGEAPLRKRCRYRKSAPLQESRLGPMPW